MMEWLARDGAVEFVEQPLPAGTPMEDLAWLKERSPLPIFADESFHHAADVAHCAAGFHGVNAKLVKMGGVSGAVEALRAARQAGLKTILFCPYGVSGPAENEPEYLLYRYADLPAAIEFFAKR